MQWVGQTVDLVWQWAKAAAAVGGVVWSSRRGDRQRGRVTEPQWGRDCGRSSGEGAGPWAEQRGGGWTVGGAAGGASHRAVPLTGRLSDGQGHGQQVSLGGEDVVVDVEGQLALLREQQVQVLKHLR